MLASEGGEMDESSLGLERYLDLYTHRDNTGNVLVIATFLFEY